MKNWKNVLLTALACVLLAGFAWLVTSPDITDEAADRHMNLGDPLETEEESDAAYDFL